VTFLSKDSPDRFSELIKYWRQRFNNYVDYTFSSEYAREADKINYAIGLLLTFMTVYVLGFSPGKYFFYWIAFIQVSLFTKRAILFRHLGYHFYLIDF